MTAALTRYGLLIPILAGALLLAVAEFMPLYEVRAITAVIDDQTSGSHHGYALLLVAIALVPLAIGAVVGGSRPAAVAVFTLGLLAAAVTLLVDLPDVRETGLTSTYEAAEAHPKSGFYLESLGAALTLIGAVGTLLLRPTRPAERTEP